MAGRKTSTEKTYSPVTLGLSMAASWTWAISIMVGMALLQNKGIVPYLMWWGMNILALPVYGWIIQRWPDIHEAHKYRIIRLVGGVIVAFAFLLNMQGMFDAATLTGWITQSWATWLTVVVALGIVALIAYGGLRWSILTDQGQWYVLVIGAFIVLVITLIAPGHDRPELQLGLTSDGIRWGLFALVNLFCAPFTDAMQWERANLSIRHGYGMKPFMIAGAVFGAYLLVVAIIGSVALSVASATLLFVVVLMASSSTIDSSASGLHYTFTHWPGVVIGAVLAMAWPLLSQYGILNLWASQGFIIISLTVAVFVLAVLRRRGWLYRGEHQA
jgi:hypothetical protein